MSPRILYYHSHKHHIIETQFIISLDDLLLLLLAGVLMPVRILVHHRDPAVLVLRAVGTFLLKYLGT